MAKIMRRRRTTMMMTICRGIYSRFKRITILDPILRLQDGLRPLHPNPCRLGRARLVVAYGIKPSRGAAIQCRRPITCSHRSNLPSIAPRPTIRRLPWPWKRHRPWIRPPLPYILPEEEEIITKGKHQHRQSIPTIVLCYYKPTTAWAVSKAMATTTIKL